MDGLTTAAVVAECNTHLRGARVNKVFQPSADELYFRLWTGSQERRLYFSCRPGQGRLHLTEKSFSHPFAPPRFCQLLRARLRRLMRFEQIGGDRLVVIHCAGRDEAVLQLLVDLRPQPNLVLLDETEQVVDLLHRRGAGERPGEGYVWPAEIRPRLTPEQLQDIPDECRDSALFQRWLRRSVAPLSKLAAADMAACVNVGEAPAKVLARYLGDLDTEAWRPRLVTWHEQESLAVLPLYCVQPEASFDYPTVGAALDAMATDRADTGIKPELAKAVGRQLKRLRKRLRRIEQDYAALEDLDNLQHIGNLLLANRHRLRRGMAELEVEDYAADPPATRIILLDPRLTPQENVDRVFQKARKRRRGEEHFARRLDETRAELAWLEAMSLAIEETEENLELNLLRKELAEAGLLAVRNEPAKRQTQAAPRQYLETTSPSGYALIWGRNPRENDRIRRELAAGEDLWFHAHKLPGSHLLLRRAGRSGEVPEEDILYAAALAAGYSRGRRDNRVEVMVAHARDVKKPKGARPGLVTVDAYQTVVVPPVRLDDRVES
ncbi:MAG TPA: NFACT RNA binding domain-containing protein [Desulfuromonadales bacterium]|nr:NFACT RNA binding domain-containing protein [Desulfuromonadales bacterium]